MDAFRWNIEKFDEDRSPFYRHHTHLSKTENQNEVPCHMPVEDTLHEISLDDPSQGCLADLFFSPASRLHLYHPLDRTDWYVRLRIQ